MEVKFRPLEADEVECRVGTVSKNGKGLSLLLYKNARVDMDVLDETVGAMRWKREHSRDNRNCTVSIYDSDLGEWVSKEDTGTESNTEAEKGLASDSFKRACVNWGIGRELYTAPFIWVRPEDGTKYDRYVVDELGTQDGRIVRLEIVNTKTNRVVYRLGAWQESKPDHLQPIRDEIKDYAAACGISIKQAGVELAASVGADSMAQVEPEDVEHLLRIMNKAIELASEGEEA